MPDPLRFPVPTSFETPGLLLRPFSVADAPQLQEALVESIGVLRENLWFLPWVAEHPTLESAEVGYWVCTTRDHWTGFPRILSTWVSARRLRTR